MTEGNRLGMALRLWRGLARMAFGLLAVYGLLLILLYVAQEALLFQPRAESSVAAAYDQHRIEFVRDGVRLSGWYVRSPTATSTIAYYGGNGEELSRSLPSVMALGDFNFLLVNYRSYGRSEGSPSEAALKSDAAFILEELSRKGEIDLAQTHLMGRSLGSGIATWLAARAEFASLILVSPYDSVAAVAATHYPIFPVDSLIRHPFRSIDLVPEVDEPTLVVKAENDFVVPHAHTERLTAAFEPQPTVTQIPGTSHNRLFVPAFYDQVGEFLRNPGESR